MYAASYCSNHTYWQVESSPEPSLWANTLSKDNVVSVDFTRKSFREEVSGKICPAWQQIAADRLDRLRVYQSGWDGPASQPVSSEVLARAGRLLEIAFDGILNAAPPAAVPCADGSLQLEWWLIDTRFELTIEVDGSNCAWAKNRSTNEETEAEGTDATNLFFQWARRLTADKLMPVA